MHPRPPQQNARSTVRIRGTKGCLGTAYGRALAGGGCALIVRNTVASTGRLRETFSEDVSLNHARFCIRDRLAKTLISPLRTAEDPRAGPHRAIGRHAVVRRSLDVDLNLLVTDLAPVI